jgi:hypothetical protein
MTAELYSKLISRSIFGFELAIDATVAILCGVFFAWVIPPQAQYPAPRVADLVRIMHYAALFWTSGELARADVPSGETAIRAGASKPSQDALADHCALELGENAQHLIHRPARGRGVSSPCWCGNRSTPLAHKSLRNASRSMSERPRRSTDQAAIISISRRATANIRASKPGRSFRPLPPEMPTLVSRYHVPAMALSNCSKLAALVAGGLFGGGAEVECNAFGLFRSLGGHIAAPLNDSWEYLAC